MFAENLPTVLRKFDGIAVQQLKVMFERSPRDFYKCVREDMNLNLLDTLHFTDAIQQIK